MTEPELREWIKDEYGNQGLRELEQRMLRVREVGTSSYMDRDWLSVRARRLDARRPRAVGRLRVRTRGKVIHPSTRLRPTLADLLSRHAPPSSR